MRLRADWLTGGQQTGWLRPILLIGSIGLAGASGLLLAKTNSTYALAVAIMPLALVGLDIAARHPDWYPFVILAAAAFVPVAYSLPTGTGSPLVISLVLTAVLTGMWVLRMALAEKRLALRPSPLNRPLFCLGAVILVSLAWGNIFHDPQVVFRSSFVVVQLASALTFLMELAAYLMVANLIRTEKQLGIMVGIMLFVGVAGWVGRVLSLPLPVDTEGLSAGWIISLAIGLALFDRQLSVYIRLALLALAGAWVYWGFGANLVWLAGWLPGFVAIGLLAFRRSKWLFLSLGLVFAVIVLTNTHYFQVFMAFKQTNDVDTRSAAAQANWIITSQHWLLGTGPAGYAVYYMAYFPLAAMATHNNFLDMVSQTGIIGLATVLWFFGAQCWYSYRLCRRLRGRGDFAEALANAVFAGSVFCVILMGFGDWLFPFAYTQTIAGYRYTVYSWLFMGILPVLDRLTSSRSEAS
jgi:O-antigen ligase